MDITITVEPEVQTKLQQKADALGQDVEKFVEGIIRREALKPTKSLDEILAPYQQRFEESGVTDDELDTIVEEVREEIWQEKQSKKV